jgi:hypothetical protein
MAGLSMKAAEEGNTAFTLRLWNTEGWKEEKTITLEPKGPANIPGELSGDGRLFLIGIGQEIRVYRLD